MTNFDDKFWNEWKIALTCDALRIAWAPFDWICSAFAAVKTIVVSKRIAPTTHIGPTKHRWQCMSCIFLITTALCFLINTIFCCTMFFYDVCTFYVYTVFFVYWFYLFSNFCFPFLLHFNFIYSQWNSILRLRKTAVVKWAIEIALVHQ